MDALSSLPGDGAVADAMFDVDQTHLEKTDPGTRHVIDLAFITSDVLFENASGDWRTYFDEQVIKRLDRMFQYSGVNVEFRVSLIAPFSEFRQYLYCDLPSIDNVVYPSPNSDRAAEAGVIGELIPIIRKQYSVDLFVAMPSMSRVGGYAALGDGLRYFPVSARWSPRVMVKTSPEFFDMSASDRILKRSAGIFAHTLAHEILGHEIGHSLRLDHDVDTLIEAGVPVEALRNTIWWTNVTTFAYGYGGRDSEEPIGTLMSYARFDQGIPLFSADKRILRSELCDIVERIGTLDGQYCSASDPEPDRLIKIGGSYKYGMFVDASEAMQYTVGIVARYGDVGVAPLDLATVSNAVTAKALRGRQ